MADQQGKNGKVATTAGAAGAAGAGGGTPKPPKIKMGDMPLPDPQRIRVIKRKVADRIMQAIERAGQRELTALSIPDAGQWNVKRPDVQELALQLTDDAFGKLITTARDRLRTGLAEELDKKQDQFQIAANLRERFGGMNERDARRVVRTVFRDLYNTASLDVYEAIGVKQVLAADGHGGLTGRTDPDCLARNGQIYTLDEARELRAYHPTVHPNCTLSFSPIMPEGGLSGEIHLPPVEDAPPSLAADLGGSEDEMLMAAWTPDEEALHPKWPQGTPGNDPSGHHLAGEFMEMGQLSDLFKSLVNKSDGVNISFLAHGADNVASIKVTGGPPGGLQPPVLSPVGSIKDVKKLQHLYDAHGTYLGQITKKGTGYYAKIQIKKTPGNVGPSYWYEHNIPGAGFQVSDSPPPELDPSATFDIVLKHPKLGQPAHIQVHVDHVSKMKTASFVKFLAELNNGQELTIAKQQLDTANKYYGGTQYAKPVIHKKLNYTKFQKTVGGGKQEGNDIPISQLKVGDTFLIPVEGWGASTSSPGEVAKVTQKWSKGNKAVYFQIMSGPSAGEHGAQHFGYYDTGDQKVTFSAKAKPPPPPPKVGDTVNVEHLKIGSKVSIPAGAEGSLLSANEPSHFKAATTYEGTIDGLAPDGGIKVKIDTGTVSFPTETQVKYVEAPPKGGASDLQPGILDQFGIDDLGRVTPPIASHAVDSSSHDPSIPIPANSSITPEMWKRFGKEDQERYVYLQQKFGEWASGKGDTALAAVKATIHQQIRSKVESAYNSQYGSTGAKGKVVKPDSGNTSGGAGEMTLKAANQISLAQWQKDQPTVDPEGQFGSWAEAMNYGFLRYEEVFQWDMFNRVGEPDLLMFHAGEGDTKNKVIDQGIPVTGGFSWSYFPGPWGEHMMDAIPMPIRYLTMNYFVEPSSHHISGEHEVSSRYFINVPKDSPYWYTGTKSQFQGAWKHGQNPKGGSVWASLGQQAGLVKLSPEEEYAALPTVKAKTMLPGAEFRAKHSSGKILDLKVDQIYSDGSFMAVNPENNVPYYFPAQADVKQTKPGKPSVEVGKLVHAALNDTQMGNKVYSEDGKVIGYVSTPGSAWKELDPDDPTTVKTKHTPGGNGTILTVLPVAVGDLAAGDKFYLPGSKGQDVAEVVSNNGGQVSWKHVSGPAGGGTGTLPASHSPVYPLPKPDSAFAPPPDPPANVTPFTEGTPDPTGKVETPYVPPPPVSGATLAEPPAQAVTHVPAETVPWDDVAVGDVLQVEKAAGQSLIGSKLEVTEKNSGKLTATYLDGPLKGQVQDVGSHQWGQVTFSKVTQQETLPSGSDAKTLIAAAPDSPEGLPVKKSWDDFKVGDVLYGAHAASSHYKQPFAVITHKTASSFTIEQADGHTMEFPKGDWNPSHNGLSVYNPGNAPGPVGGTVTGSWGAATPGATFVFKGGGNPSFIGAEGVIDSVDADGTVHYHYTKKSPQGMPGVLGKPVVKHPHQVAKGQVQLEFNPPAPEAAPEAPAPAAPTLTKTKVGTMKVGDHLYSYTTENYVGEVTSKHGDGGVTVTKPDGSMKVYGAKSSVKKSATGPGAAAVPPEPQPVTPTPVENLPNVVKAQDAAQTPPLDKLPVGTVLYGASVSSAGGHQKLAEIIGPGDKPDTTKVKFFNPGTNIDNADLPEIDAPNVSGNNEAVSGWFYPKTEAAKMGSAPSPDLPETLPLGEIDTTTVGSVVPVHNLPADTYFVGGTGQNGDLLYGHVLKNEGPDGEVWVQWLNNDGAPGVVQLPYHDWDTQVMQVKGTYVGGLLDSAAQTPLVDVGKDEVHKLIPGDKLYYQGDFIGTVIAGHGPSGTITYKNVSDGLPATITVGIHPVQTDHPLPETLAHDEPVTHALIDPKAVFEAAPTATENLPKMVATDLNVGDVVYDAGGARAVVTYKDEKGIHLFYESDGGTGTFPTSVLQSATNNAGGWKMWKQGTAAPAAAAAPEPPVEALPAGAPLPLIQISDSGNKKASSFAVGQAAYSYHSGKLIGTVTAKDENGVTITKPDGTTKTYKATTTWRYDKNPAPAGAPSLTQGEKIKKALETYTPPPTVGPALQVEPTLTSGVADNPPDHIVPVYDSQGHYQGVFDPGSPYNVHGHSSVLNGGGIAEFVKPDGTLSKIGGNNLKWAPATPQHLPPGVAGLNDASAAFIPDGSKVYYKGEYGHIEKQAGIGPNGENMVFFVPDDPHGIPTGPLPMDTEFGYQTKGDEGLAPLEPGGPPAPPESHPNSEIPSVGPGNVTPITDLFGGEDTKPGTPIYDAEGDPLGTFHHWITYDDGTEGVGYVDTDGNTAETEAYLVNVHTPNDEPGTPAAAPAAPAAPVAPEPAPEASASHPDKIDPKANPSKKAGSFAVGQPVYNYHSGKLIGTVSDTGHGYVTVTKPNGDTKMYKATTTWKYLGGSAGAAHTPPVEVSPDAPPESPNDVLASPPPVAIHTFTDVGNWNNMGAAGGTQGAQWFTDPATGQKYVVKGYGGDQSRVATEALAGAIYKALGVDVPDTGVGETLDGKRVFVSKALPGNPKPKVLKGQPKSEQLGQGFMADALLANHDVVGLDDDNVLWDANGKPYRVDVGGTFFYRAMGGPKAYGPVPNEVTTMLDPKRQAGRTMIVTDVMKKAQAANIANTLTPAVIQALVDGAGFPSEEEANKVRDALLARVDWMGKYAKGEVGDPEP